MMAVTAIVETVRSRIAAATALASESVTAFDGSEAGDTVIDTALNERGVAIYVYPIINYRRESAAQTFVRVTALILVRLEINPEINAKVAHLVPETAVAAIINAVVKVAADANDTQFELAEEAVSFDDSDPGLLAFNIFLTKDAVI